MNAPAADAMTVAHADARVDCDVLIAALRECGAARFDPVRLHYIEALAARARAQRGHVGQTLAARLSGALSAFEERFALARRDAGESLAQAVQRFPDAADQLQRFVDSGDFKGLRRAVLTLEAGIRSDSLVAIVRQLNEAAVDPSADIARANPSPHPELKAIRRFRGTWSRISVDNQVAHALAQAPRNAGPINSHMLVLRSLALMRDISPDYLNRFMSYAETLLCLEQQEAEKAVEKPKKRAPAKNQKK